MLTSTLTSLLAAAPWSFGASALAVPPTRRQSAPPPNFTANPSLGGGGSTFSDSAHFRIYNLASGTASAAIKVMEAAHQCFITELGWRSPGLSIKTGGVGKEVGPWYKTNIYSVPEGSLGGSAGQQWTDANAGLSYLKVVQSYTTVPSVIVHEFAHAMHYSEETWVDQTYTGAWWETIANFMADMYVATSVCESARAANGVAAGDSLFVPKKVIGDSFQVIIDGTAGSGNYYEAWPLLSYMTNNPDGYNGLGKMVLLNMIRKYKLNSNETPLHSLERLLSGVTVQKVIGRYWARMAYVDIGHSKAQSLFNSQRGSINYANVDSNGNGKYTVKSARAPRYMGANIIPLKPSGTTVKVVITASGSYTATLVVKANGSVKYVDVVNGNGSVSVASGNEVSLVVANTPSLTQYDAFSIPTAVNKGLSYSFQLMGATV